MKRNRNYCVDIRKPFRSSNPLTEHRREKTPLSDVTGIFQAICYIPVPSVFHKIEKGCGIDVMFITRFWRVFGFPFQQPVGQTRLAKVKLGILILHSLNQSVEMFRHRVADKGPAMRKGHIRQAIQTDIALVSPQIGSANATKPWQEQIRHSRPQFFASPIHNHQRSVPQVHD